MSCRIRTVSRFLRQTSFLLLAVLLAGSAFCRDSAAGDLSWQKTDSTLALMKGKQIVWKFNYGPELHKPFFDPVATLDGRVLSWNTPPDHAWHHGVWFSWKYLNQVNYWEINKEIGKPDGLTSWSGAEIETRKDGSATIRMNVNYIPPGKTAPLLVEVRQMDLSTPAADGSYHIDWQSTFTAKQDVVLDRTPPKEKSWGGYAGLSIRFAKELEERQACTTEGEVTFDGDRYRGHANAADYNGVIDGKSVGIAFLDHPNNPRNPTPWYLIRSKVMGYANAAILNDDPLELKADAQLKLQYRLIIHADRWDAKKLQTAYEAFANSTAK